MHARERRDRRRIDTDHARVLGLLEAAGETPLTPAELDQAGVPTPATIVYELELRGFLIDRVGSGATRGFRLSGIAPDAAAMTAPEPEESERRHRARRGPPTVGMSGVRAPVPSTATVAAGAATVPRER
jgi:hypothetical protein